MDRPIVMLLVILLLVKMIAGYTYLGCVVQRRNVDTLPNFPITSTQMTPQFCIDHCTSNNNVYSGTMNGPDCYCSNDYTPMVFEVESSCNEPCTGDNSQMCGGSLRLSVYHTLQIEYSAIGCLVDDRNVRTLPFDKLATYGIMTTAICEHHCRSYAYFGLETGFECFCGNDPTPFVYVTESECTTPCTGAAGELCGGDWRLTAYQYGTSAIGQTSSIDSSTEDPIVLSTNGDNVNIIITPPVTQSSSGTDYITDKSVTSPTQTSTVTDYSTDTLITSSGIIPTSSSTTYSTDRSATSPKTPQTSTVADYTTDRSVTSQETTQTSTVTDYTADRSVTSHETTQTSSVTDFTTDRSVMSQETTQTSLVTDYSTDRSMTLQETTQTSLVSDNNTERSATSSETTQTSYVTDYSTDRFATSPESTQTSSAMDYITDRPVTSQETTQRSSAIDYSIDRFMTTQETTRTSSVTDVSIDRSVALLESTQTSSVTDASTDRSVTLLEPTQKSSVTVYSTVTSPETTQSSSVTDYSTDRFVTSSETTKQIPTVTNSLSNSNLTEREPTNIQSMTYTDQTLMVNASIEDYTSNDAASTTPNSEAYTTMTSNTSFSCSGSTQDNSCFLVCRENANMTIDQLIQYAIDGLPIDKTQTQAYKYTKACMPDSRPSSRNIGVVGLILSITPFVCVVIADVINMFKFIIHRFKKVNKMKRRNFFLRPFPEIKMS